MPPIFDYKCNTCDKEFEKIVLFNSPEVECECGSKDVQKKPCATTGVRCVGDGFYKRYHKDTGAFS